MDFNPIAKPLRLAIRENHIHVEIYHTFQPVLVVA